MRIYRIPFSTNVERVALALGHKDMRAEWIDVDPTDRSAVRSASGQDLVPVLEHDGEVVVDSTRILAWLEERFPQPPLYPAEPARRAEVEIFLDWFNRVWKVAPNAIEAELGAQEPDRERIDALGAEMSGALGLFEALLADRAYLYGNELSAADCAAFPFLRYALLYDPSDTELFHRILRDHQPLGADHPRLAEWIRRVDEHPRG
jgi:glutathione S-transferase